MARLLSFLDKEPSSHPNVLMVPAMAEYHLCLAKIRRDHGLMSDKEMAKFELKASSQAQKSKIMFNPFTGEVRKVDIDGNLLAC